MKKIVLAVLLFLAIPAVCFGQACDFTIDGYSVCNFAITDWKGLISAPAISASGHGRIYYDPITSKFQCSEGGGSYFDCFSSGTITQVWTDSSGDVSALTAGSGDTLDASGADSTIPTEVDTTAAPTTEGRQIWDSDNEMLCVGDGINERCYPTYQPLYWTTITGGGDGTAIDASVQDPVFCSRINNDMTVRAWYLECNELGSIVLDVWKNTWDDTVETDSDSIASSEKPTLSNDVTNSDTGLIFMTTDWNAGDNVCIEIESSTSVDECRLIFTGIFNNP